MAICSPQHIGRCGSCKPYNSKHKFNIFAIIVFLIFEYSHIIDQYNKYIYIIDIYQDLKNKNRKVMWYVEIENDILRNNTSCMIYFTIVKMLNFSLKHNQINYL